MSDWRALSLYILGVCRFVEDEESSIYLVGCLASPCSVVVDIDVLYFHDFGSQPSPPVKVVRTAQRRKPLRWVLHRRGRLVQSRESAWIALSAACLSLIAEVD